MITVLSIPRVGFGARCYMELFCELVRKNLRRPMSLSGMNPLAFPEMKREDVHVEIAMRYGNPSISAGLDALKSKGCMRIAVLPLYPQFAGATTASVYDGVSIALEEFGLDTRRNSHILSRVAAKLCG